MLFNSYTFIFAFLPVAVSGYYLLAPAGRRAAASWLVLVSVVFYGWWDPASVILLLASVGLNYAAAARIAANDQRPARQAAWLTLAITINLAALVYYKYLPSMVAAATGWGLFQLATPNIVLPLGISFFTFTQIGYLIDTRQGVATDRGLLNYLLFVTFFPHLIAGPILHHREIMPQFARPATYRFSSENLAVGLSIFVIGLLKKCLLADTIGSVVAPGFDNAAHLPMLASWNVALSYSLQLYFDFSGYSDMAIGLARMFNVTFPLNFNSPYKAASIIEHWQRWHMTLSRYLALYLYNPIALAITRWRADRGYGIDRAAQATPGGFAFMVMLPVVLTMGLAGIWHGAGLQFLIFGLLHGTYLTINHAWRILRPGRATQPTGRFTHAGQVLLTYLATLVAAVFFRAPSTDSALALLGGMVGQHGFDTVAVPAALLAPFGAWGAMLAAALPVGDGALTAFVSGAFHFAWMIALYFIVFSMPNTQQIMRRFTPALGRIQPGPFGQIAWQPDPNWAVVIGVAACIGVLALGGSSEFLYFQF